MNAEMNNLKLRNPAGQWFSFLIMVGMIGVLMTLAYNTYASDGTEFAAAVTKWESWVKGSLGKLAALIAVGVGAVVAAVKKDWTWFFGAVVLSIGVGIIVGIVDASFTATI